MIAGPSCVSKAFRSRYDIRESESSGVMVHLVIGSNFSSAGSCSLVEDVNFRLPDVIRLAWVSEEARLAHQPQIERVRKAWNSVEWRSILSNIRPCACIVTSPECISLLDADVSAQGLKLYPLRVVELTANQRTDSPVLIDAVIGRRRDAQLFVKAWKRRDTEEMGRLLGYPRCCREFYRTVFELRQLIDQTWPAAMNTTAAKHEDRVIRITATPWGNSLLRTIGLKPVLHLPCSFECAASLELGTRFSELMCAEGYAEEVTYLREALQWPAEWSGLHGIAEIRTPVVKICTRTDSTAQKLVVQWLGSQYPREGARGLTYPFIVRHPDPDSEKLVAIQPK
jgi:hypothetical protein